MRAALLLALVITAIRPASAQDAARTRYADVRLTAATPEALLRAVRAAGVEADHGGWEGSALRTTASTRDVEALRRAGAAVEVLDADLAATVARRTADHLARHGGCPATPYPVTGSMGCYPTFDEVVAILDSMHAAFPDAISARASIGQGHEGRDLWMVEISDNPGVDEQEPEALYTALHHAREPQGIVTVLHFMWDLLTKHAAGDPEATDLVANRRLFFVPMLNPDGYVYNQTTDPNGGGYWRKNRRDNGDGSVGVDLNRNYGYEWGFDDVGSSPFPESEVYRGSASFSEPETAALRAFVNAHRIRLALNYHTYSNLLLYAWGFTPTPPPNDTTFARYAAAMTAENGYTYGPGHTTIYPTNGNSDDWMYGATDEHALIYAYTPEVGSGSDGFWPQPSRILPLAEENLLANYRLARFAGEGVSTAAAPQPGAAGLALAPPAPNPAGGPVALAYALDRAADVRLAVYDALGREVAVLVEAPVSAGAHEAVWDGRDGAGRVLPAGVYLVRLTADGRTAVQRLTRLR